MKQFVIVLLFITALAASVQSTLLDEEAHERHVTQVAGSLHGLIRAKFKFLESLFGVYDTNDGNVPVNIGHAYASGYGNAKSDDTSARSAGGESENAQEKVFLVKVSGTNKQSAGYAAPQVVSHPIPQPAPQHVSHAVPQAAPQVASYAVPQVTKYAAPQAASYSVPHANSYVPSHAAPHVASHASYGAPQVVSHAVPQHASYAAHHVASRGANYGTTYAAPQAVSHAVPQRVHYAAHASSPVSSYVAAPRTTYAAQHVVSQPAPQTAPQHYAAPHIPRQPAVYATPHTATYAAPQVSSNHVTSYSAPQTTQVSHAAAPVSQAPQNARGHGPGVSFKIEKVIQKPFGGSVAGHFSVNAGIKHNH